MKKRILINIHYLEIGGAERALIGLLNALNRDDVDVDLFINQHTGDFMQYIPSHINLIPQEKKYFYITQPIGKIISDGEFRIAYRRLIAKRKANKFHRTLPPELRNCDISAFQYLFAEVGKELPDLYSLGEYDLAISFIAPHNFVLEKVRAKIKVCWIHIDYSTVQINKQLEYPIWSGYDYIASISDDCSRAFAKTFPELEHKLIKIENILSSKMIREQSEAFVPNEEMPRMEGERIILSIGRIEYQKRFDEVARMCRIMLDSGLKFKWYIIGYGDENLITQSIKEYNVDGTLILLGKKTNPYPYIKRCDIYVQPSRYEGKSVTVREAQILCKPVAITNYPTASSQIIQDVDGHILPFETDAAAVDLSKFAENVILQSQIIDFLASHDYGNESEVDKVYNFLK